MEQSSTILQMFTPIGARYLPLGKKIHIFLIGDLLGAWKENSDNVAPSDSSGDVRLHSID